jgi:hypothetical protein
VADIGLFTREMADLADRQTAEDAFQLIGIHLRQNVGPWAGFRDRFPWLMANVTGGLLAAFVTSRYESLLDAAVVLALFIPVVLALAESVSIQSVTLTLSTLHHATSALPPLRRVAREIATATLLGIGCGVIVGGTAGLWQQNLLLFTAISVAITLSMITASLVGLLLPTMLRALRKDPNIASGPIVLALPTSPRCCSTSTSPDGCSDNAMAAKRRHVRHRCSLPASPGGLHVRPQRAREVRRRRRAGAREADGAGLGRQPAVLARPPRLRRARRSGGVTAPDAQGGALGREGDLREAGKAHDQAVERALKSTLAILAADGHPVTDATRQGVLTTLRALPSGEPPGRLTRTLQPGGFEMLAGLTVSGRAAAKSAARAPVPAPAPKARGKAGDAARARSQARAKAKIEEATRKLKLAEQAARREEFEAARAAREAEKAERRAADARAEFEAAREALEDAEAGIPAAAARDAPRDARPRRPPRGRSRPRAPRSTTARATRVSESPDP